ncbi:MAG: hypothetical protein ACRDTR_03205, partial [Rubrobacter sp.]
YRITLLVAVAAFLPVLWRAFPGMPLLPEILIALVIAVLAGYAEHRKNVEPHLSMDAKRTYLFGYACKDALADLRGLDPTARLNILEIDPALPGREGTFRTVYTLGMEGAPDKDLGLKVSQGVCGQAVEHGEFTVADLEVQNGPTFGLDPDQLEKTERLTLVLSMPIKKTTSLPDGTFALADEVLGVVNMDSAMAGAHAFYRGERRGSRPLMDEVEEEMATISELCSFIMS